MPYARQEIPAADVRRQMELCEAIRVSLGDGERFALVDTYGCQQNESDS